MTPTGSNLALTKQTDVDWAYPIIAFLRTGELSYFEYPLPFVEYPQWVFNNDILTGMELIDSDGEQWFVHTVTRTSPAPPRRRWWQIWPFYDEPHAIIELGLERGGQVDFQTVLQRACDSSEATDRQNGVPEEEIREWLDELREAKSYEDIADVLALADMTGFLG